VFSNNSYQYFKITFCPVQGSSHIIMVVRTFLACSKIVKKPLKQSYPLHSKTIGEHIRKKRIDNKQTQLEVSMIIGIKENTLTTWEVGRWVPQVHHYPTIIEYLGYYPFVHETESIAGKLLQVRYCNGWSCKEYGEILVADTATVRRWELYKSPVHPRVHSTILGLWHIIPTLIKNQYLSLRGI
jgi:DNA-binding XRE family transcriptional regulator